MESTPPNFNEELQLAHETLHSSINWPSKVAQRLSISHTLFAHLSLTVCSHINDAQCPNLLWMVGTAISVVSHSTVEFNNRKVQERSKTKPLPPGCLVVYSMPFIKEGCM